MDRVQLFLLSLQVIDMLPFPKMGLLLNGESCVPLLPSPIITANLHWCLCQQHLNHQTIQLTYAGENYLLKKQFSPGLVIWTGLLCLIYNQHYRKCKGMVQHHITRRRKGESKTSVSGEPHTIVSAQTKPQQQITFVGYTVALVHSTLFYTFPPFLSPRIFLSAQKENSDEFQKEGRVPTPTLMP